MPSRAHITTPVQISLGRLPKKEFLEIKMASQHIELTDSGSNREEEHDNLTHGVIVNKLDYEKTKFTFIGTTIIIDRHKSLPIWEEIFRNFDAYIFPDISPLSYPEKKNYDDKVYVNNKRYKLHMIASRPPIFPCIEVIKWIINHLDIKERHIKDSLG